MLSTHKNYNDLFGLRYCFMANQYIAIDIGGSFIKFGVLNEQYEILFKDKIETPQKATIGDLYSTLDNIIKPLLLDYAIQGIAVSAPGVVTDQGTVEGASAVRCIHGPNIKEDLQSFYQLPVSIENDANCAALAEVMAGSAKGLSDVLFVVCGTGIGGAVISNGKLHKGRNLMAGEFGLMMQYDHEQSRLSSFSSLASTGSLAARASKAMGRTLFGQEVFDLADAGDEVCKTHVASFYSHLALLLTNVQSVYDPELIVVSGGVTERQLFAQELESAIATINDQRGSLAIETAIKIATFKNDANLIGALSKFLNR